MDTLIVEYLIDPSYYCYNTIRKKQFNVISEKDSRK